MGVDKPTQPFALSPKPLFWKDSCGLSPEFHTLLAAHIILQFPLWVLRFVILNCSTIIWSESYGWDVISWQKKNCLRQAGSSGDSCAHRPAEIEPSCSLFIAYYFLVCVRTQRELLSSLKTMSASNTHLLISKHIKSYGPFRASGPPFPHLVFIRFYVSET